MTRSTSQRRLGDVFRRARPPSAHDASGRRRAAATLGAGLALAAGSIVLAPATANAADQEIVATNITSFQTLQALNPWGAGAGGTYYNGSANTTTVWSGGTGTTTRVGANAGLGSYELAGARLTVSDLPASCDDVQATVTVTLNARNNGPNVGYGGDTAAALADFSGAESYDSQSFASTAVGSTRAYTLVADVPASALRTGDLAVSLGTESNHGSAAGNHYKTWNLSGFSASYELADYTCTLAATLVDDSSSTPVDTPKTIDIVDNDTIPDGSSAPEVDTTSMSGGTIVDNGDGTVTYTPPAGFTGTDTFTYRVTGPDGVEHEATVTVIVTEEPDPPVPMIAPAIAGFGLLGLGGIGVKRLLRRKS